MMIITINTLFVAVIIVTVDHYCRYVTFPYIYVCMYIAYRLPLISSYDTLTASLFFSVPQTEY
jgi:hypothetical protein